MAFIELHIHADGDPALLKEIRKMSEALDRLTASVTANQSATDSALQLITTIAAEIRARVDDDDTQALFDLADKLDSESAALANAVAANTPAAPGATGQTGTVGATATTTGTGGDAVAGSPSSTVTTAAPGSAVVGEVPPAPADGEPDPAKEPDPLVDGA